MTRANTADQDKMIEFRNSVLPEFTARMKDEDLLCYGGIALQRIRVLLDMNLIRVTGSLKSPVIEQKSADGSWIICSFSLTTSGFVVSLNIPKRHSCLAHQIIAVAKLRKAASMRYVGFRDKNVNNIAPINMYWR